MTQSTRERRALPLALPVLALLLAGCTAPKPSPQLFAPTEAQTKLRSFQTRTFDGKDRAATLRGVMVVLQDLGFIIERANEPLGLVTGEKFAEPDFMNVVGVTVTVRAQGENQMLVRVNAIFNNRPVEDPTVYQNFFAALERSLFATGG
jgi:hypothetical protein